MSRPYGEENISSEYGENPEVDSIVDQDDEEDFYEEDYEDQDWGDANYEEEVELLEEPLEEDFDSTTEYEQAYKDFLMQQNTEETNLELELAKDNILDRMGLKTTSRPDVRRAAEQADAHFQKSFQAELEGRPGEAKLQRLRAAYHGRDIKKGLNDKTAIEQRAESEIMSATEKAIKAARSMTAEEYRSRYPKGRGLKEDLTQLVDSFNKTSKGSYLYVLEAYSPFDENLGQIKSDRPVSGKHLRRVKLPEWTSPREVTQAARDSNSTLLEYLCQVGLIESKTPRKKREEVPDNARFENLKNQEYRKARGLKLKMPVLGGKPRLNQGR